MKKTLLTLALTAALAPAIQAQETVPWSQPFSGTLANVCAAQEKNPSNRNWIFYSGQLRIQGLNNRQTDSYIWFPKEGLSLEVGHTYRVSVQSKQASLQTDPAKKASINVGIYDTPASGGNHTDVIEVNPLNGDYDTYTGYYNAASSSTVYIGLNTKFYSSTSYTYFQNLNVIEVNPASPGGVTALTAAPDADAMQVALSFTAPTLTLSKEPLAEISGIVIYRDGNVVTTLTSVTPGQALTFTDNVFQPGAHLYTVVAFNEAGDGEEISSRVTLGTAAPNPTKFVTANYNADGTVTIDWSAMTNLTEGAVYTVTASDGRVVAQGTSELSATDNIPAPSTPARIHYVITDGSDATVGTTNTLSLYNPIPFLPTFTTSAGLGEFVFNLANSSWWQIYGADLTARKSYYQADNTNPEGSWLITPGLMLSADKIYRVVVDAYTGYSPMNFYVNAGKGNNAADMTTPVIESTRLKGSAMQSTTGFFKPEADGQYFFGVNGTLSSSSYSEYLNIKHFNIIEADGTLPAGPTDLNVVFDPTDSSKARLTFKAPALNLAGGEATGLTKIEVYKDGELFTTITDNLSAGQAYAVDITLTSGEENTYLVVAYTAAGRGESAQIPVMIIQTPYIQDFNNEKSLNGFTLLDKFDAGYGWHLYNNMARCYHTSGHGTDAWLITPPIHLEGGKFYHLVYNGWGKTTGTKLGVYVGKHPTEEAMTQTVTQDFDLDTGASIYGSVRHAYFTVEETGEYYLGYHATGPDIASETYVDNIILSEPIDGGVPAMGTLEVIPDWNGAKKAQVRFTIPQKSLDGEDLPAGEEINVNIYRNLEGIAGGVLSGLPGQTVSTVDEVDTDNVYLYSGAISNSKGEGPTAYTDVFVGLNRPSYPVINSMEENPERFGEVTIGWIAPTTDTDGYPFNPELATYDLSEFDVDREGNPVETSIATGITGTSYTYVAVAEDAAQSSHRYVLRAKNSKGERSQGFISDYVVLGTPSELPYEESFAANTLRTAIITTSEDGTARWGFMPEGTQGITAADGDGGYFGMEAMFIGSVASVETPKVNLAGTDNPVVSLMVYNYESAPCENRLQFFVRTLGGEWESIAENSVDNFAGTNKGWQRMVLPLGAYKDKVVSVKITGTCVSHTFTMIDKLTIRRQPARDLAVTAASIPAFMYKGKDTPVKVTVKNNGIASETDYTVSLFINGEKASSVEGREIAPDQELEFQIPYTISPFDNEEWRYAEVTAEFQADEETADNTSQEVKIHTVAGDFAPVEALSGEFNNEGVALSWNAPLASQADGTEITEDFENYDSWSDTPSPWLTYDADGKIVALVQNAEIPGLVNATKSFWIFDSTLDDVSGSPLFASHSGNKMIVSICPHDQSMQDDWLISPLLSGEAQTVSFFARSFMSSYITTFEVRYSDGSLSLADFKLTGIKGGISGDWTEYTFNIPEGARRFAIRNISNGGFFLMVDDITYVPASASENALTGFNVYYGKELLSSLPASENTYTDASGRPDGSHIYNVTALYPLGESAPEEVMVEVNGLEGLHADRITVTGAEGYVLVKGAESLNATLTTPDGRIFFNGTVPADGRIASPAGVVVVNIAGTTAKVSVK